MTNKYNWVDNPTVSGVSDYNPDILNENLMHLKYDNISSKIVPFSFNKGNTNTSGEADLIDAQLSTDLVFAQAGTYTVVIPESANYDVTLIGGGAGGAWGMDVYAIRSSASGGSGAAFIGNVYIPAGTYQCSVGGGGLSAGNGGTGGAGGATYINGIISAGGGQAGAYATWGQLNASSGGLVSINTTVNSSSLNSSGNNGTTVYNSSSQGGLSLFNGFGKGGSATQTSSETGVVGYLSIKMSGQSYINYKIGGTYPALSGTTANGETFTVNGLNSDDATTLANGTYIKYVGPDGSVELLKANLYRQSQVTAPLTNDVWLDTRFEPVKVYKYNGTAWVTYDKVPLGKFTVSNGAITSYKTYPYNQNGYDINSKSPLGKPSGVYKNLTLPASGGTIIAPYNGYVQLAALSCTAMQLYNKSQGDYWDACSNSGGNTGTVCIPCQKGDVIQIYYEMSTSRWFRCYADQGAI